MRIIQGVSAAREFIESARAPKPGTLSPEASQRIVDVFGEELGVEGVVARIIEDVIKRGDEAVLDYARLIDGVELKTLKVTEAEIKAAELQISSEERASLEYAAERVRDYHLKSKEHAARDFFQAALGQRVTPIGRAGIYVPGGTALYPSTVLMTAGPAKAAGVEEVTLATPPKSDGEIAPIVLAAANMAGVDRVFAMGGAQAIAAMAYGTEAVPRVDKIFGPGNIFVQTAKRMVYGQVGVDTIQGPTEAVVIVDESVDPEWCAADVIAQAEHDSQASSILITTSAYLAEVVEQELERQLSGSPRESISRDSLEQNGAIVVVDKVEEAIELSNLYAPEHLCLMVRDADSFVSMIKNTGAIFIGEHSPHVLGDYVAGPSHALPTGGAARYSSTLGVGDFLKITSMVSLNAEEVKHMAARGAVIARSEGFEAHARALDLRASSKPGTKVKAGDGESKTESKARGLVRSHLREMVGYTPVQPVEALLKELQAPDSPQEVLKLDANENPYGPSPNVYEALSQKDLYHVYPDPEQRRLRLALAEYVGLGTEHIVVGNGSDELLDLIVRLVLEPGEKIINCVPTFGMYKFEAEVCGGIEVQISRNESYDLDVEAIEDAIDAKTKVIFVASPNNPTGNYVSEEDVIRLAETGLALVIDEAYFEFCQQTAAPLVAEYDNLMVVRTFSKWAGLAGVRVGYGIFSPEMASYISQIKPPYNVSIFAQEAALESLKDRKHLMSRVEAIIEERERLFNELARLDYLQPFPSLGNFILCEVTKGDARDVHEELKERRIFVRYFDTPRLRNFIRISVGRPEHTESLMSVLRDIGDQLDE